MTREEAKRKLTNTKVYVNGKSKEIQEKLFEIGFRWGGYSSKNVSYLNAPFLFIGGKITCGSGMQSFKKSELKEVSADDILNIKLDEEFVPKHGDIIFATDKYDNDWITIFNKTENENVFSYMDFDVEGGVFWGKNSPINKLGYNYNIKNIRPATEEEKDILFGALKGEGLVWNEKTKEVETIKQSNKELEFKPFDKVLVRDNEEDSWIINLYGEKDTDIDTKHPYRCIRGDWSFCIPYEGNEELLGTSNSPK